MTKAKRKTVVLRLPKQIDRAMDVVAKLSGVRKGDCIAVLLAIAVLQRARTEPPPPPRP